MQQSPSTTIVQSNILQLSSQIALTFAMIGCAILFGWWLLPKLSDLLLFGDQQQWPTIHINLNMLTWGLSPVISAFIIVEIVVLAVPRWRALRIGGYTQRRKMLIATAILSAIIIIIQTFALSIYLSNAKVLASSVSSASTIWSHLALIGFGGLTSSIVVFIGYAISRWGLGHGFSIVILLAIAQDLYFFVRTMEQDALAEIVNPLQILLILMMIALAIAATWILLHRPQSYTAPQGQIHARLQLPLCGALPIAHASVMLGLPATLHQFGLLPDLYLRTLSTNAWIYAIIYLIMLVILGLIYGLLFHRIPRMAQLINRRLPKHTSETAHTSETHPSLQNARRQAMLLSLFYVCGFAMLFFYLNRFMTGTLSVYKLMLCTAIIADIWSELLFRSKHGSLCPVYPIHRVYEADIAIQALNNAGIAAHPRGIYHRALLHFFGPFVTIDLLVPTHQSQQARDIMQNDQP